MERNPSSGVTAAFRNAVAAVSAAVVMSGAGAAPLVNSPVPPTEVGFEQALNGSPATLSSYLQTTVSTNWPTARVAVDDIANFTDPAEGQRRLAALGTAETPADAVKSLYSFIEQGHRQAGLDREVRAQNDKLNFPQIQAAEAVYLAAQPGFPDVTLVLLNDQQPAASGTKACPLPPAVAAQAQRKINYGRLLSGLHEIAHGLDNTMGISESLLAAQTGKRQPHAVDSVMETVADAGMVALALKLAPVHLRGEVRHMIEAYSTDRLLSRDMNHYTAPAIQAVLASYDKDPGRLDRLEADQLVREAMQEGGAHALSKYEMSAVAEHRLGDTRFDDMPAVREYDALQSKAVLPQSPACTVKSSKTTLRGPGGH